ncbi:MAG: Spi family protease inhibitor [Paramuribaculum sp.]|jgi:hypothetical protein
MKKLLCMLLTAVLAGCTNESPVNHEPETCPVEPAADARLLIDPQSRTLDSSDAAKVAMLFQKRATGSSSRTGGGSSYPIVTTITDEASGNPLLYIVNHGDNGGFAIVSASKMTEPLLAYSESGNPGMLLDQDPGDPYYDYAIKYVGENPSYDAYASYTDCFHMNMGAKGVYDAWCTFNIYGGSVAGYKDNLNMIVPVKP